MTPLPRGHCSVCGSDVALRKGGVTREHQGSLRWIPSKHTWKPFPRICKGSGKAARR